MRKGFTLIELLAVIVILAIIALIATPIILEVINNAKEEAAIRSAENYLDAVELSIAKTAMDDSTMELNGTYVIIDNGKKIQKGEEEIEVNYDGEGLETGKITIKDGKITRVMNAKIGNQTYIKPVSGETKILDYEPIEVTLLSGQNFNAAIKTLVSGETKTYTDSDIIVTSIEFLSYGMLPEGYTLKELQNMKSVNVSAGNDNKIMVYYDEKGKVFIYSKDLIVFNSNSSHMFYNFQGMESLMFNEIDTSNVTDMSSMFRGLSKLSVLDLSDFDTSNVIKMGAMFSSSTGLTELDLSSFNTSKVTGMESMFAYSSKLTKLDVSSFDTSRVTNMSQMFRGLSDLTQLDVSHFKISAVTNMQSMFHGCGELIELDVSNFKTSTVTNMQSMFKGCSSLTELNVSNFDTKNVINMSGMFSSCTELKELDLSNFDTSGVTDMNTMFEYTKNLQNLDISNFTFNKLVNASTMFVGAKTDMNITINKNFPEEVIILFPSKATIIGR